MTAVSQHLRDVLAVLPLLTKNEMIQVEQMCRILAIQKRADTHGFVQLYTVLQTLFTKDGHRIPPLYVLSQRGGTARRDVEFALESVEAVGRSVGLSPIQFPKLLCFLYDLCRAHMQNAKIKVTLRTMCTQLQQSRGLLNNSFPDYPSALLRQLVLGEESMKVNVLDAPQAAR